MGCVRITVDRTIYQYKIIDIQYYSLLGHTYKLFICKLEPACFTHLQCLQLIHYYTQLQLVLCMCILLEITQFNYFCQFPGGLYIIYDKTFV